MVNFDFYENCYNCRNCENVCPVNAIEMVENKEGTLIPKIDKEKCINCGVCDKKCPYLNFFKSNSNIKDKKWYGVYHKDKEELVKSTSGAVFPAIVKYFLKEQAFIVGCVWNDHMKAIHTITNKENDINRMRGSKYVYSDLNDVVKKIKSELIKGKKVLFIGVPCQIAAVKQFIDNDEKLYTCSLICEGAPADKIWQKYKSELEQKYHSKMTNASFRSKEISWEAPTAVYNFEDGKRVSNLSFGFDKYVVGFLEALYYRKVCSNCQYKGDGHNGDIIIGDLWGATKEQKEKSDYKGISLVIINTEKGQEIFENIKQFVEYEDVNKEIAINNNMLLMQPIKKHINREKFFKNFDNMSFEKNVKKCVNRSILKGNIKNLLYKMGVYAKMKVPKDNTKKTNTKI